MASVFYPAVQRSDIRNREVHVIGEIGPIQGCGLPTLTDTRADPFSCIDLLEQFGDPVQIIGRIFGCQIVPVQRIGLGLEEVTVFNEDNVGIQQFGQLFLIGFTQGIGTAVSFGYQYRRTVKPYMTQHDPLLECPGLLAKGIDFLCHPHQVFFGIQLGLQRFDSTHARQGLQLFLQFAGCCHGEQHTEERKKQ